MTNPVRFMGAVGSPYTRKLLAALRFRRIPHQVIWGSHNSGEALDLPQPKVKLLPTVYLENEAGELEALTDSTPLLRRFEREVGGRALIPADPVLAFLNDLIEDYGDEWLTKAMFHYRWHFKEDELNAGPLLVHWNDPSMEEGAAGKLADMLADRQVNRLYVVGSNDVTAETIESSYTRFLDFFNDLLKQQAFLFGNRPSTADYALYGQLTQLVDVDPTPARIAAAYPRIKAWVGRIDDLSGLEVSDGDWLSAADVLTRLRPLIEEIGRVYCPALVANAKAAAAGEKTFQTEIDGRPWEQPTFPYQAKCFMALRAAYSSLQVPEKEQLFGYLEGCGCGSLT